MVILRAHELRLHAAPGGPALAPIPARAPSAGLVRRCFGLWARRGVLLLASWAALAVHARAAVDFPEPAELALAVAFWKRVYVEVSMDGGLLHDHTHLGVIYEVVRFEGAQGAARESLLSERRARWQQVLRGLARGAAPRDEDEVRVLRALQAALEREPSPGDLYEAAERIRFQLGLRDEFRRGVVRSGAHEAAIREVFRKAGMPGDLAHLPHVESSFNVRAYSKYGAAGLWQFMRSTGSSYLRITDEIDERLDPAVSTRAAAQLLAENYRALQSWPLALTAYNHGRAGMLRAKTQHGSDIVEIIRNYRSPSFGFASRNFYAQFLAARDVMRAPQTYLGPLQRDPVPAVEELPLPFYLDVADLYALGVSEAALREQNPALRNPVFSGSKRIPQGYVLRLAARSGVPRGEALLAAVPRERRFADQHRVQYYEVRRGDTLSAIARRAGTSVAALVASNGLKRPDQLRPGLVLQLPATAPSRRGRDRAQLASVSAAPAAAVAAARPATPRPSPRAAVSARPAQAAGADPRWARIEGGHITVDADETLGHYALWLEVSTARLRQLNGLPAGASLRMGQRIRLDLSRVDADAFLQRRSEHHKGIAEDFFGSYEVVRVKDHRVRRGDSIWELSTRIYGVPAWLIQRYNPDADLVRLAPGSRLVIPVVREVRL